MTRSLFACLLVVSFVSAFTVQAGTKEELVRLQNDVITLQNQFREFERTLSENNTGLKSLIEQLNDQVAESNMLLKRVASAVEELTAGENSDTAEMLPEIQKISGKIDEMATGISALARQVSELKVQSKPVFSSGLSGDATYNQALQDLIEGNFDLAIQGFNAYLNQSPEPDRAAGARYYIGEAYYNMDRFPKAAEIFTGIIDEETGSDKVASALYKRGKSFLEMQESDRAAADFKKVMEKFPDAPEAGLAKAELQNLGIPNNTR